MAVDKATISTRTGKNSRAHCSLSFVTTGAGSYFSSLAISLDPSPRGRMLCGGGSNYATGTQTGEAGHSVRQRISLDAEGRAEASPQLFQLGGVRAEDGAFRGSDRARKREVVGNHLTGFVNAVKYILCYLVHLQGFLRHWLANRWLTVGILLHHVFVAWRVRA